MSLNLTILLQILNVVLTLQFLKKYLFGFLLEMLQLEEQKVLALEKVKVVAENELAAIFKQEQIEQEAVKKYLADNFDEIISLQAKKSFIKDGQGAFLKQLIIGATQKEVDFAETQALLMRSINSWAQK